MRQLAPQVAVLGAFVGILSACDSPARVKPWRHAPDPTAEAARAQGSPILAAEAAAPGDIHSARVHTLRIHVDAEPGRLSPIVSPSIWARRITLGTVFEPLLRYVPPDGQGPGRYTPRLAQSWRVMPNGLEIRIELEPDVTFHDGRPLTTSDVQFTLDAVRDAHKGVEHLRPMLDDVDAIELITSHEIRLRLKRPSGLVLRALAEIPILPMHIYDGSLLAGGALVGTGPWKFVSNKAGIVHLTKFDRYWGGPAPIADLEFVYEPDAAVALTAAKRGEIDLVPALVPAHWPEQATSPGIAAAFRPLQLAPPKLRYLVFNAARPLMEDPRVRHAIALLVDRRAIGKRVFGGLARPALWPIWPGGPIDGAEASVPDFDPATAAKLLAEAGWIDTDKDGIRDRAGKQLRLIMIGGEKPVQRDASGPPVKSERDYFVEAARRIGVVIEVKTGGESFLDKRLTDGRYDLIEESFTGIVDGDPTVLVGGKSATRPVQPRVDRALDAMGAAWDPAERAKLAPELAAALAETWPIAGIVADAPQGLVHKRIKNVKVWDGWIDLGQLSFDPAQ
ncbi:MAG: extracellular solute-binding protein family 5 [Myxococcales bacterium]|nr:extracellular solute-binding protein family 5 [Myxococcales bacterium]